ncbi:hypothetical protein AGABI2DRAFT_179518 [Agaricus bisporus var. bisporus H97]|uniref:hypothetical protein n=1 Tax=Agaricus bisporus var. bisporus (strain H97 / ATCC MYA-4626 / FGSC 10389) TaxID=936046 RepID=UPI00029F7E92|nr:hypothetical protein AGABI2DRAFT_179518 [Agaricus bisporus var. bisporus H97]EKV46124.1 hypothetical protein AGABI2DRAFT_179518 [Agaricus bisporus var. bisporus H97]
MPDAAIFLQDACLQHNYIRSKDKSSIVERPERLRAINIGISGALARLESVVAEEPNKREADGEINELTDVLGKMRLGTPAGDVGTSIVEIVKSQAEIDLLNHEAVKFIHGDIEGDVYLENLKTWAKNSWDEIAEGGSEIPLDLPQGDLYLCPESINAIQGALGTVCEAVDRIVDDQDPIKRAFVAVRPPGHHCGEDTPSGFCFVNNVAVAAAHAYLKHKINRIVIFDIDLHHGNGTQSIVWSINEETYRQTLEAEAGAPEQSRNRLRIYYGSIHDVLSFPCEDGNPALVQAASVSIHKAHGQYVENIHLQTYESENHFWDVLYKEQYSKLILRAEEFINGTGGPGDDVLVFISCGMDACEHEYPSMSRHNRKVPASFYHRFTNDARTFAGEYSSGKLISVLEGGYSDRALISGSLAHVCGLAGLDKVDEEWWNVENLIELEKATKKRRGGRPSLNNLEPDIIPKWLERTVTIFNSLEQSITRASGSSIPAPPSTRTLRDRTKLNQSNSSDNNLGQIEKKAPRKSNDGNTIKKLEASTKVTKFKRKPRKSKEPVVTSQPEDKGTDSPSSPDLGEQGRPPAQGHKPVTKVILKLGKAPEKVDE